MDNWEKQMIAAVNRNAELADMARRLQAISARRKKNNKKETKK